LYNEGYKVIVVGEKEHPEIKSIKGFANDDVIVVNSIEEAKHIPRINKIGVVAQTTLAFSKFKEIVPLLLEKANEIRIYNTICSATAMAQNKSLKLSKEVDIMIVIGGKNSANTRHLYELCRKERETYHIEDAKEIKNKWFKGKKTIGITAGASTPDWVINDVISKIKEIE
jgi:4-hydroxy-3-methylbut-2-enyl diphosphate reductase